VDSDDVSRTHAQLLRIDDEYTIEDLDSRNGVFLNGLQVHAAVLRDGDQLQLGDVVFTYNEGS
ncbi:MAG: FHA domain-containing protein, partial [Archangium sp.]|nr:FHA domain-containing protein [Archangium sp.]